MLYVRCVSLRDTAVNQLDAFLKSLTDPCVKDSTCIGRWMPDTSKPDPDPDPDPDSRRLLAQDKNGALL